MYTWLYFKWSIPVVAAAEQYKLKSILILINLMAVNDGLTWRQQKKKVWVLERLLIVDSDGREAIDDGR